MLAALVDSRPMSSSGASGSEEHEFAVGQLVETIRSLNESMDALRSENSLLFGSRRKVCRELTCLFVYSEPPAPARGRRRLKPEASECVNGERPPYFLTIQQLVTSWRRASEELVPRSTSADQRHWHRRSVATVEIAAGLRFHVDATLLSDQMVRWSTSFQRSDQPTKESALGAGL